MLTEGKIATNENLADRLEGNPKAKAQQKRERKVGAAIPRRKHQGYDAASSVSAETTTRSEDTTHGAR